MVIKWLRIILFFIMLVLLQVWIFNKIHLFGVATPLLYVYFILKLSSGMNRNAVVIWAFILGLAIDILNNTPGLNALATTIIGFVRYYLLNLMSSRDEDIFIPSLKTMGFPVFLRYSAILVFLHHIILFSIEAFSVLSPITLCLKITGSALLTLTLIFAVEFLDFEPLET